jgi:hypothetical protein
MLGRPDRDCFQQQARSRLSCELLGMRPPSCIWRPGDSPRALASFRLETTTDVEKVVDDLVGASSQPGSTDLDRWRGLRAGSSLRGVEGLLEPVPVRVEAGVVACRVVGARGGLRRAGPPG